MKGQGREKRRKGWEGGCDRRVATRKGNGQHDVAAWRHCGAVGVGGQPKCAEFGLTVTGHAEFLIGSLTKLAS